MTRKIIKVNCNMFQLGFKPTSRGDSGFRATYTSPHQLLVEGHLGLRSCHLREEGRKGLDQVKEAYYSPPSAFDHQLRVIRHGLLRLRARRGFGELTAAHGGYLPPSPLKNQRKLESKTS